MSNNNMHTLQSAINEIRLQYNEQNHSATLYNIHPECAKRVFELLSSGSNPIIAKKPITFTHSATNNPAATFILCVDDNVK